MNINTLYVHAYAESYQIWQDGESACTEAHSLLNADEK